jgi:ubiquinone/menaquinone biosynthesis C-methylase UbiE
MPQGKLKRRAVETIIHRMLNDPPSFIDGTGSPLRRPPSEAPDMTNADSCAPMLAEASAAVARPRPSVVAAIGALALRSGQRVLDAGCGPGAHLGLLLDEVAPDGRVVGLDVAADRVGAAASLWGDRAASGRLGLATGDVGRLPFAGGSFDVAWISLVLHHVAAPVAALRELARVVVPGGLVAVLDGDGGALPCLPWPPVLEERVRAAAYRGAAENYGGRFAEPYHPYLGRELPRFLREAGLTEIEIKAVADVDAAPLDSARATELRAWFRDWVDGRLRDYLAPTDQSALLALVDPEHPAFLLDSPDFFFCRTWLLATGRVPR